MLFLDNNICVSGMIIFTSLVCHCIVTFRSLYCFSFLLFSTFAPNFQIELLLVEKIPTKSDNLFSIQTLYAFACANFRLETLAQP
jgi:hypothetical protein